MRACPQAAPASFRRRTLSLNSRRRRRGPKESLGRVDVDTRGRGFATTDPTGQLSASRNIRTALLKSIHPANKQLRLRANRIESEAQLSKSNPSPRPGARVLLRAPGTHPEYRRIACPPIFQLHASRPVPSCGFAGSPPHRARSRRRGRFPSSSSVVTRTVAPSSAQSRREPCWNRDEQVKAPICDNQRAARRVH